MRNPPGMGNARGAGKKTHTATEKTGKRQNEEHTSNGEEDGGGDPIDKGNHEEKKRKRTIPMEVWMKEINAILDTRL